jgi:hypothetical protein
MRSQKVSWSISAEGLVGGKASLKALGELREGPVLLSKDTCDCLRRASSPA